MRIFILGGSIAAVAVISLRWIYFSIHAGVTAF